MYQVTIYCEVNLNTIKYIKRVFKVQAESADDALKKLFEEVYFHGTVTSIHAEKSYGQCEGVEEVDCG